MCRFHLYLFGFSAAPLPYSHVVAFCNSVVYHVVLFLKYDVDTLVPVTTVPLGDPATFTCSLPAEKMNNNELHWYQQNAGQTLRLIVKLRKHAEPAYGPDFSSSRVRASKNEDINSLTILKTVQEDEGMYHCAIIEWTKNYWHGTYLLLTGNSENIPKYQIVQEAKASAPDHESNSLILQCSVTSDFNHNACPEDISVFWFKVKSDQSHPNVIYVHGDRNDECQKKYDLQRRCVFSKNIRASDAGKYYCAVASCGEIFLGTGQTKDPKNNALVITITCLQCDYILIYLFSVKDNDNENLDYAALQFSGRKSTRGTKKKQLNTEEDIYAQVKV
uniref:Ig-like domain-containing protein n=1 Tax=Poecilia reticulata TaxID=8081 RepID=A0A3P9PHK9_POERE